MTALVVILLLVSLCAVVASVTLAVVLDDARVTRKALFELHAAAPSLGIDGVREVLALLHGHHFSEEERLRLMTAADRALRHAAKGVDHG